MAHIEVNTKEEFISEVIFTPYTKGLYISSIKDWKKLQQIITTNLLLKKLKFAINADRTKITVHGAKYDWFIQYISFQQNKNYITLEDFKLFLGYVSENIVIYFSKNCPETLKSLVRKVYIY